jgi:hypothetical protein
MFARIICAATPQQDKGRGGRRRRRRRREREYNISLLELAKYRETVAKYSETCTWLPEWFVPLQR